ncbi:MAG: hypothetical protein UHS47_01425 [Oscillospiraceae bacterium]|nr:hypothetical protein [Oscillospiraceae bacterium]
MTNREFERICKAHGFVKQAKHLYVRCFGDGVFQSIYCGFSTYIDQDSPNYSSSRRKSNYISIGIYSLFSQCKMELFDPSERGGGGIYSPNDFCPQSNEDKIFHGIEHEYDKMNNYVFSMLDEINTQEALLDFYCKTKVSHTGSRVHSLTLVEPFLLTGQIEDALIELSFHFTHTWVGKTISLSNSPDASNRGWIFELENHMEKVLAPTVFLWRAILGKRHQDIIAHLSENYDRNIGWISQFDIPLSNGFHKRKIPHKF